MHFSVTDLPVPEPPMMTRLSPGITLSETPASTCLAPKALRTSRSSIRGVVAAAHQKKASVSR